ncbi:MAG: S24 family peptidase [Syntrophobacteraceae bacterium]|nr:hypothetical protein [Desulfobacteraceae bacterium]
MSLGSRLEELRGSVPIADFAQLFGIHKNTYSNYVKQLNVPDCKFILDVCQKFSISPNWLLLGAGPKYLDDQLVQRNSADFERQGDLLVPLIETWVIGREGEITHDGILEYVPIKRKWLEKTIPDLSEERLRCLLMMRVRRDYMAPTVTPGDLILLDTERAGRDKPSEGEIFLVRLPDGERAVKRVALADAPEGCKVFFFSDNTTAYPIDHFTLPSSAELHRFVLGRVLWLFREL